MSVTPASSEPGTGDTSALPAPDRDLLQAVVDAIPARVAIIGRDFRYIYGNPEFLTFLGRPAETVIGHTADEVLGRAAFARLRPSAERALAGETIRWEGWFTYPNGAPRYIQQILTPYRTQAGSTEGMFAFTRDLTDLKLRERELAGRVEELQASEALGAAIVNSSLDCVIVVDEAGRVVEFNAAAEETFGYRRDEAVGRLIGDLIIPADMRPRHNAGMARYLATGVPHLLGRRVEFPSMRRDGTRVPVELTITEVRLPERRLFTAHMRDLTEAKNAATEIERQRDALYQGEKLAALGSLLAGVAHELNNPLSIVIGHALMMQDMAHDDSAPAEALADRARKIELAADRCARVVRSFLAIARQKKAERERASIADIVAAAVELLAYGLRAADIGVETSVEPDMPPVLVNSNQIHQVLVNLIVNARQALEDITEDRHIIIRAAREPASNEIVLSVSDSGTGVPEAIRTRIFDPFFTTKPQGEGTGIGLSVSRGLVEANGGSLRLRTAGRSPEPPSRCGCRSSPTSSCRPDRRSSPRSRRRPAAARCVVDDEEEIALLLAEILERMGLQVDLAASGREAKKRLIARGGTYDVVLCDIRMPDMDGPALFRWIEEEQPWLKERIAFVTGDTLGPAAGRFLARSGCPVIEKPFVPSDIRRVVATLGGSGALA